MKREQLFEAIGAADPALLEHSGRPASRRKWVKWSGLCAACLFLVAGAALLWPKEAMSPVMPDTSEVESELISLRLDGGDVGELHLSSICYGPQDQPEPDFVIYINEELYQMTEENGVWHIRPINALPEDFPECSMEIAHLAETPQEAAKQAALELADIYQEVSESGENAEGLWVHGSNGSQWDAEQEERHFVDDGQGGCFVMTARYFTEATEGHGARFQDMMSTFQVVPSEGRIDGWLGDLQDTADRLIPAIFSDDLTGVEALLAENAQVSSYGEDVSGGVSIAAVDYTADNDQAPVRAVVSVKHRVDLEDSVSYLTMEFQREGEQWLLTWAGIEK